MFILQSGGPTWDVPKGRKDGRISKASETIQLPSPSFNISQLQQSFSQRGLSLDDLVALSGKPHTNAKIRMKMSKLKRQQYATILFSVKHLDDKILLKKEES